MLYAFSRKQLQQSKPDWKSEGESVSSFLVSSAIGRLLRLANGAGGRGGGYHFQAEVLRDSGTIFYKTICLLLMRLNS